MESVKTSGRIIIYFGGDEAFYKSLCAEFLKVCGVGSFSFLKFFDTTEERIQSLYLKVIEKNPAVVFIDYSKQPSDYAHLARILVRTNLPTKPIIIGLHDNLSERNSVKDAYLSGVPVNHIKGGDIFDVVYSATKMLGMLDKEHSYATAELTDEWTSLHLAKVGFASVDQIHFETDFDIDIPSRVRVHHFWQKDKIIPSLEIDLYNKSNQAIYYHYENNMDGKFLYVDELPIPAEIDQNFIEKKAEREHDIKKNKLKFKKWLEDNASRSAFKGLRVLVIDKDFNLLQNQKRTDRYDFNVRCQPYIDDIETTFKRDAPHLIAWNLRPLPQVVSDKAPDPSVETDPWKAPGRVNDINRLGRVIEVLNSNFPEIKPNIVVFNCANKKSEEIQDILNYPKVMTVAEQLSSEILLKMADIFTKRFVAPSLNSNTVFMKKNHESTMAFFESPINLIKVSEVDMAFTSKRPLKMGTPIYFKHPFDIFATVVPSSQFNKPGEYYAVFSGGTELTKMEIRKFVNSVFFREHDEEKNKEVEAFKALNETKLKEAIALEEAAKKALEEKAALEAQQKAQEAESKAATAAANIANTTDGDQSNDKPSEDK
jgi:hypothetical protein